jgi:hypothetical protein
MISKTDTVSLQSEQGLSQQIRQIRFQQSLLIDLCLHRLSAAADMAHTPMVVVAQYHHLPVKLVRGGTAMRRMVRLQSPTLQAIGNDPNPDPGNGPMTGTFDDDVGKAAQKNVEETVIQRNMTLGTPTDAARVWTRVKSQKSAVL